MKNMAGRNLGSRKEWVGKDKLVLQTNGKVTEFYMIDLRLDKVTRLGGGGVLWNHAKPGGLTMVGSVLYAIGILWEDTVVDNAKEEDHINKGTSCLDLAPKSKSKWKDLPPMVDCYRRYMNSFTLGKKIIVFGNIYRGRDHVWAAGEYFDTSNYNSNSDDENKWEVIPLPPEPEHGFPMIADPNNNRILGFYPPVKSMYAYYPDRNSQQPWECLDDDFICGNRMPASSVSDDGVLYFVYSSDERTEFEISAYDMETKQAMQTAWTCFTPFGPEQLGVPYFEHLLYLGDGILCLYHYWLVGKYTSAYTFYRIKARRVTSDVAILTPLTTHTITLQGTDSPCNLIPCTH